MYRATKDIMLPTTITGSLPRPSWYTENLGLRTFMEAMVSSPYREQYVDAVSIYLKEQEVAGLDIVTDGDAHFDQDVGGQSWTSYPPRHMSGFDGMPKPTPAGKGGLAFPRGHILHDYLEARVMPSVNGPIGRGNLQYAAMWKTAQRHDKKTGQVRHHRARARRLRRRRTATTKASRSASSPSATALNEELHELADAGCPVIQMEEPQIHLLAVRKIVDDGDQPAVQRRGVQQHREGPACQDRGLVPQLLGQSLAAAHVRRCADLQAGARDCSTRSTPTSSPSNLSSGGQDLEAIGKIITDKKIAIGVIDHHTLQVERPEEVAAHIRMALKHIPPERLVISSDCGMGREGMSRRHAFYKVVSLVLGTNIVRRELGVPESECLAADDRYSLVVAPK